MLLAMTQQGAIWVGAGNTNSSTVATGSLKGCLLKLVNNSSIPLNSNTKWGDVSAFIGGNPGYGDGTITWTGPFLAAAGNIEYWSNLVGFSDTASTSPQNYSGIVVTDPGTASVYFAAPFDNPPIVFNSSLSAADVLIRYNPAFPNSSIVEVTY